MKTSNWILALGVSCVLACGGDDGHEHGHEHELPEIECPDTVPSFSMVTAFQKCVPCHDSMKTGAARANAPEGYNYDNYEDAVAEAEHAAHAVYEGTMPPGGSLTEEEKQVLYQWALCGTPQ